MVKLKKRKTAFRVTGRGIISLVSEGDITIERAAEKLNKPVDEIRKLLKEYAASAQKEDAAGALKMSTLT